MVFCEGTGSVMNDGFGGLPQWCSLFLFNGWVLNTPIKFAFALLGTLLMAIASEVLRVYRVRWDRECCDSLFKDMFLSVVYGIHMINAYFLMLLIMLYDSYFLITIITGLTIGHFVARRMQQRERRRHGYESLPPATARSINPSGISVEPVGTPVAAGTPCCR
eukprot:m.195846 g.195846  ORF g.195846 m.195846 type:complete len:163 (+) comp17007_c0_seq2:125-613(+)